MFKKICLAQGTPDIDLFASKVSHQISQYTSWILDPFKKGWDTFQISWNQIYLYAFLYILAELFDEVCQYNTIGLHRSALSAFHDSMQVIKIGYRPRVCDLMSGLFNQRSLQPNYTVMWDAKIVLEYLRNFAEDNFLLDKTLTFKLVLLLTLILAFRASEMTNLNFNYLPKSQSVYILPM